MAVCSGPVSTGYFAAMAGRASVSRKSGYAAPERGKGRKTGSQGSGYGQKFAGARLPTAVGLADGVGAVVDSDGYQRGDFAER